MGEKLPRHDLLVDVATGGGVEGCHRVLKNDASETASLHRQQRVSYWHMVIHGGCAYYGLQDPTTEGALRGIHALGKAQCGGTRGWQSNHSCLHADAQCGCQARLKEGRIMHPVPTLTLIAVVNETTSSRGGPEYLGVVDLHGMHAGRHQNRGGLGPIEAMRSCTCLANVALCDTACLVGLAQHQVYLGVGVQGSRAMASDTKRGCRGPARTERGIMMGE